MSFFLLGTVAGKEKIDMVVAEKKNAIVNTGSSAFIPIRMMEIEIGTALPILSAFDEKKERSYACARCLVRLHTQLLGTVELQFVQDKLAPEEYAPQIWQELHDQINEHLRLDGLPLITDLSANGIPGPPVPRCIAEREQYLDNAPFVSVIIPTHDRTDLLTRCLDSLLTMHYPHYEIIVVDNAPATNATVELIEKYSQRAPHIVYVRENRQGPSWARNCGIMMAKGEILAFTDDDVVVDSYWLAELVRGFARDTDVACVTGLVLPMEIDTPAQFLFEATGSYDKGYQRQIFVSNDADPKLSLHPYAADRFGTGASMALTAAFLRSVGGFDPALGRVGPVRCAQDIAVFFQVVAHGNKLVYEPAALNYHLHRREYLYLRKQTYNHAVGFTAYLTKSLSEHPWLLTDFMRKIPRAIFLDLRSRFSATSNPLPEYARVVHKELIAIRRKGLLYGPIAYMRSRWQLRSFHHHNLM
jgi:glycosyltransferase involved in cell wall biosynthesis